MDKTGNIAAGDVTVRPMRSADETAPDWRSALPELEGRRIRLREPQPGDATALFSLLSTEEVARFISPPPPTVEAFERFIGWAQRQRAAGQYVCFAVVPRNGNVPIGLFHVRALGPGFGTADWGFAIGSEFWGSGLFAEAAELILDFAFDILRTHRLEARAAVCNGRGNGAMKKIGAEREGLLRHSFYRNGDYVDQILWSVLHEDWKRRQQDKAIWGSSVIH